MSVSSKCGVDNIILGTYCFCHNFKNSPCGHTGTGDRAVAKYVSLMRDINILIIWNNYRWLKWKIDLINPKNLEALLPQNPTIRLFNLYVSVVHGFLGPQFDEVIIFWLDLSIMPFELWLRVQRVVACLWALVLETALLSYSTDAFIFPM